VAARAAAFSDPEVKAVLASSFVPIAENASYLQRQQDAEGDLFRLIAEQGHYGGRSEPTDTRQGMYACTADGRLLASCNVHGADRLLPVLRRALARWAEAGPAPGPGSEGGTDARYLRQPPPQGLVLRVWSRDLPRDPGSDPRPDDWRRRAFNLDHAWFTAREAEALLPAPAVPGAVAPWPAGLARRLFRYHCIDNVRGEPPMWQPQECEAAEAEVCVRSVQAGRVWLSVSGQARLRGAASWVDDWTRAAQRSERGLDVSLQGDLEWDGAAGRFTRCELLAAGTRWGATQYNSRADDPGPAPIGWAFDLADGTLPGDATPPQGVGAGYFAAD